MKLGRITFVLLLLFILNVLVSACGKDSNKRAVKVSNGKSGSSGLADQNKAGTADSTQSDSNEGAIADRQNAKNEEDKSQQVCGLQLNDDMSASDPCLKERESKQIIDNRKFEAKQVIVTTLQDSGNESVSTYTMKFVILDKKIEGTDVCGKAANETRVVTLRLAVDLSNDGKPVSMKTLESESDESKLGLIFVPEESHVDLEKVVRDQLKRDKDYLAQEVIRKVHFGLKDLNFSVNGKDLIINQDKIDLELDLFNEEESMDYTLKTTATVCEQK